MDELFNFAATPQQYDRKKAYALGLVSSFVYLNFEQDPIAKTVAEDQAKEWGLEPLFFEQSLTADNESYGNDAEAIALVDDQKIIIGFRGTEPKWREWFFTNFNLIKVIFPDGRRANPIELLTGRGTQVHAGFHRLFSTIWHGTELKPGIRHLLKDEAAKNKEVWITGHSLGGAMAVLAAASCQQESIPVTGVYTYGQPKVGNQNFAQTLDFDFFRVVNNNDIVTRVPNVGYDDAGVEKYFNANGQLLDGASTGVAARLGDRLRGRYYDLLDPGSDGLKDHAIGVWWAALGKDNPLPSENTSALNKWFAEFKVDQDETYVALLKKSFSEV